MVNFTILDGRARHCCLFLLLSVAVLVYGQNSLAQTPTAEQLQQLQSLTPDQKQQLIKALGGGTATVTDPGPQQVDQVVQAAPPKFQADADPSKLAPLDSMVIELSSANPDDILFDDILDSLGKRVYQLDSDGALEFPGVGKILLAGLSTNEVKLRLEAEPVLSELDIQVFRLPMRAVGSSALRPYGYDLFSGTPTTFAPATDIPVPVNYVVGPGDVVTMLIFGQQNAEYRLSVGRDGQLNIPDIGPVPVAGMRFDALRDELTKRVQERYIGVNLSITMGELRSIRVFVLGDVNRPGSYTVSGLSTMTNALFVSGGIAENGSLRNVQLKRRNRVVGSLDLYDLLLKGNTRDDRRLQPGDVIYVPPVGKRVSVFGQVNRPAIYELKTNQPLSAVIDMSGGLLPSAYRQEARIVRYTDSGEKSVITTGLTGGINQTIQSGDEIEIFGSIARISDAVSLKGHVIRESSIQWRPGMRLLDLMPRPDVMKQQADQSYVLIRRESRATGKTSLLTSDWLAAYQNPASAENVELENGDSVVVFSLASDRASRLSPYLQELRKQADSQSPALTVSVNGKVRAPGMYPYEPGMRVSDLVRASGSILENAYLDDAELTRFDEASGVRDVVHLTLNLGSALEDGADNFELTPYDVLTIKEVPLWREQQTVEIQGEVRFPGKYAIKRGERLSDVIERAGGATEMAFVDGSVFLREDLRKREQDQLARLTQRARAEVASISPDLTDERQRAEALLQQLQSSEAVGRLVIDLNQVIAEVPQHDIILEDGDRLFIPPNSQEVTVIGEVQYPTSHIYTDGLDQYSYIQKSGGTSANADRKRIYVVRADGNVIAQRGTNWFRLSSSTVAIRPGDTIVVPLDARRISSLTLWSNVSAVIYNIGVAAAAVASF